LETSQEKEHQFYIFTTNGNKYFDTPHGLRLSNGALYLQTQTLG